MAPAPEMRVFLDTKVIFSGLYSGRGAPGIILEAFIRGEIQAVISQQVLEELVRTINEKLPAMLPVLKTILVDAPPEVVANSPLKAIKRWTGKLDLGDGSILAVAISARVEYFITGDNHLLDNQDIIKSAGIEIVTPAQFLARLNESK
jgi:putative PIN family toxin of toxin-antitoxin system